MRRPRALPQVPAAQPGGGRVGPPSVCKLVGATAAAEQIKAAQQGGKQGMPARPTGVVLCFCGKQHPSLQPLLPRHNPPARVQEEAAAQQADFDAKEALREKRRKEQVGRCVENWGAVCVG